jgi:hypothetical protein
VNLFCMKSPFKFRLLAAFAAGLIFFGTKV